MSSLVKCCSVGAALSLLALVVSACGKTDVTCEDLYTCPPDEPDAGGVADSSVRDGAESSVIRDAGAQDTSDTSVQEIGSQVDVRVVDVSSDGANGIDADAATAAAEAAPDGEAGIGDATQEQEAEAAIPCDGGVDPTVDTCFVNNAYGVFVSPTGSDGNDGSKGAPFRTIGRGIALVGTRGRVFVCGGSTSPYAEALAIGAAQSGIVLYGGFDCTSWVHSTAAALRAVVRPSTRGVALTVQSVTALTIYDFEFDSANAVTPGESSVATFFASSTGVRLNRVRIAAGAGAPGSAGVATADSATLVGVAGMQANAACAPVISASPGTKVCAGGEMSIGGQRGAGAGIAGSPANSGGAGASTPAVVPLRGQGGAGEGQNDAVVWDCTSVDTGLGQPGGAGADGAAGMGATTSGTLTPTGWQGTLGTGGTDGHIGQGGGGGGGARAPGTCAGTDAAVPTGASGGSGGSGGCGGVAGGGGSSGGSSIALAAYYSDIDLVSCEIITGAAGRGGDGGRGQQPGTGGQGGPGSAAVTGAHPSCAGGTGGRGGAGGTGGGGAGGSSLGIVATSAGGTVRPDAMTAFDIGLAGGASSGPTAGAPGVRQSQLVL